MNEEMVQRLRQHTPVAMVLAISDDVNALVLKSEVDDAVAVAREVWRANEMELHPGKLRAAAGP